LLVCLGVFVAIVAATRYVSLASVVSMALLPAVAGGLFRAPGAVVTAAAATALLVIAKHLPNLKRLAAGTERKLGKP
nr:glycerol-3-phosphate acyltransferase [Acidobacteriota bacterium]